MKHLIIILSACLPIFLQAQNADTLLYENFETGGASFTLNSADQGGVSAGVGYNQWILNDEYTGGSGQLVCSGFPTTFTVPDTPTQPTVITGDSTSTYMHMSSDAGQAAGIFNCSYLAANGLCGGNESNFSRMSQDISTVGYDSVQVSFIWLCAGSQNIYGELYYSIDAGASWTVVTTPTAQYNNQSTWATRNVSIPAFSGQPTLRFGFRFANNISFQANDPGFAIDEFLITASVNAPAPVAAFSVSDSTICAGSCVDFTDLTSNSPSSWFWIFPGGTTSFSTQQNPAGICYNTPGTYDVTLIVENASGTDTLTVSTITVFANPAAPVITASGDTLFATPGFATYEWSLDSVVIPGAVSDTLTVASNGYYSVTATDSNGCSSVSTIFLVNTGIVEQESLQLKLFPNPVSDVLFFESELEPQEILIYDFTGKKILYLNYQNSPQHFIDVSGLSEGLYVIRVIFDDGKEIIKSITRVRQ